MLKSYSTFRTALFLVFWIGITTSSFAQNFTISAIQSLIDNNSKLRVEIRVRNQTGAPLSLGRSDIRLTLNNTALNLAAYNKNTTLDGLWDDNNSPRFYQDVLFPYIPTEGGYFIYIRRTANDTIINPVVLGNNQEGRIGTIEIPIRNCRQQSNLVFDGSNSIIRNFQGVEITQNATFTNSSINLAPEFIDIYSVTVNPGRIGAEPTRFCQNDVATVNVAGGVGNSFRVYRKPSGTEDTIPLSGFTTNRAIPVNLSTLSSGDSLVVFIRNNFCVYKLRSGVQIQIDEIYTTGPSAISPLRALQCRNASNSILSVSPLQGAVAYEWQFDRPGVGTFVGPTDGTSVTINWDDNYTGPVNISVRGINACNPTSGALTTFSIRIDQGRPATPNAPRSVTAVSSPVCLNNPDFTSFTTDLVARGGEFIWRAIPEAAVLNSSVVSSEDTNENTRTFNVEWNPYFQGTQVRISVRNENSCGASDSAFVVFNISRLPAKPAAITTSIPSRRVCQPSRTSPVSVTFSVTPAPGSVSPSPTDGYRWAFERVQGDLNQIYTGSDPVPVVLPADLDEYSTNTNNITVELNPDFYGWFKVVAALAGSNCNGFNDNSRGIGQGFSIPTSSAIGDTLTYYFFVSPRVRNRTVREFITGRSVICRSANVDTLTLTYPTPVAAQNNFATRYNWELLSFPGRPNPSLLGAFVPNDTTNVARLAILPNAPIGDYFVRSIAANECSQGDTSRVLRIRVSSRNAFSIDTVTFTAAVAAQAGTYARDRYRLCKNLNQAVAVTYRVRSLRQLPSDTNNRADSALFYRWTISPANAGAIVGLPAGPLQRFAGRADSSAVTINFSAAYLGPVRITVRPVNGCNFNDTTAQLDSGFVINTNLFRAPLVFAGIAATTFTNTSYRLGGDADINTTLPPSYEIFNGRENTSLVRWNGVASAAMDPAAPFSLDTTVSKFNPILNLGGVIAAQNQGTVTTTLTVRDSVNCQTAGQVVITVRKAYNVNIRAMLEGPANAVATSMHDSLWNIRITGGERMLKSLFERRALLQTPAYPGATFLNTGSILPELPTVKVVDQVILELVNPANNRAVVARGHAFLMTDGSIRDAEQGSVNLARLGLITGTALPTGNFKLVVRHRNHLPVESNQDVVPQLGGTPGFTPATGFVDFTLPANVARSVIVSGIDVKILGSRAAMIAGNINNFNPPADELTPEVNALDIRDVGFGITTSPATRNLYSVADVNLTGNLNINDYNFVIRNAERINYSVIP